MDGLKQIFILTILCVIYFPKSHSRKFSIIGGKDSSIFEFPYQCGFQANNRLRCGCSIISNKCILTAAHCTSQFKVNITVRVGSTFKERGGTVYKIGQVINYPLFDRARLNYDYALLIPDRNIRFNWISVSPVALAQQDEVVPVGTECTVSGWGLAENKTRPTGLRSVNVKMIDQKVCENAYNTQRVRFKITDAMFCAGYMEGGKDSCSGDSGGPLVTVIDDKVVQVGVVSSGYGCALENFPGIYANVGKVRNWIEQYCEL